VDIVINNLGSGEDAVKSTSKNNIINAVAIAAVVSLLALGLILHNILQNQNAAYIGKAVQLPYVKSFNCDYILNTSTMKAHKPSCKYVNNIDDENRKEYNGTEEELQNRGYTPCGHCQAW